MIKKKESAGVRQSKDGAEKTKKMKLTPRDIWLFLFLHETRFLRREQIERLFFAKDGAINSTTKAKANRRLAKLLAHGFIERIFQPAALGKLPAVYSLGKIGFLVLSEALGQERRGLVYKKRNNKVEWLFLDHALGISEFRVDLELALNQNDNFDLLFWQRESKELNAKVTDPTGEEKYLPVTPDAFFGLKSDKGDHYFFLEIDRGTESLWRIARKILAYKQYWKSGKYSERYYYNHFRVLFVAESNRRLANLMEATISAGGKKMFLFATVTEIHEYSPLGDVWASTVDFAPRTLID